ncbi:alpha/beta fold hydrolase [Shewanella woodyi]|uniref:alpha/beta fold hydrolase n=1 Tax=Shewanella woodyi TaxID=60961 RepID=UPI0007EC08B2|nr:alpha/beta hydrolase [Shewanella woodyi]
MFWLSISILILILLTLFTLIYLTPSYLYCLLTACTRTLAGFKRKEISIMGERIVYLDNQPNKQDNNKPTLVMLHGFTANKDNWPIMSLFLRDKYRIIALDLLGHGESDAPLEADYSIEAQVQRIHEFITAIELPAFHLLGNSMGAQIAATYAALFPDELISVTLLDSAGIDTPIKSDMIKALNAGHPHPLIDCSDPIEYFDYVFGQSNHLPLPLKREHLARQADKHQLHHKIFNDFHNSDLLPYLDKIKIPVLIIWGEKDRILDKSSIKIMCPLLNQHKVCIFSGVGHLPMIEVPKKSAIEFKQFISEFKL